MRPVIMVIHRIVAAHETHAAGIVSCKIRVVVIDAGVHYGHFDARSFVAGIVY